LRRAILYNFPVYSKQSPVQFFAVLITDNTNIRTGKLQDGIR